MLEDYLLIRGADFLWLRPGTDFLVLRRMPVIPDDEVCGVRAAYATIDGCSRTTTPTAGVSDAYGTIGDLVAMHNDVNGIVGDVPTVAGVKRQGLCK